MGANRDLVIAGGGIAGLAVALAAARAGWDVRLHEKAAALSEVGAGLQLGPNATRVLTGWGLEADLSAIAAVPERLVVRSAVSGCELGELPLGDRIRARHGAPYFTLHRADLQALLLRAISALPNVRLELNAGVCGFSERPDAVTIETAGAPPITGHALIGADGLHSAVRECLLGDGAPRTVGDLAYRALLRTSGLPAAGRANQVTAWLGPDLHVVQYPVRAGAAMNVVALVHGAPPAQRAGWDHDADAGEVEHALARMCLALRELVAAAPRASLNARPWGMWVLEDRPPVSAARQMARGRVALAGDAAHPMRPYLAQGAGMAIEDADELGRVLSAAGLDLPAALQRYAEARWRRCARVQARSESNGRIFHLRGLGRIGRDAAIRVLGKRLLDVPWLYGGR